MPQETEEPSQTGDNLEGDEGVSHEEVCVLFHLESEILILHKVYLHAFYDLFAVIGLIGDF